MAKPRSVAAVLSRGRCCSSRRSVLTIHRVLQDGCHSAHKSFCPKVPFAVSARRTDSKISTRILGLLERVSSASTLQPARASDAERSDCTSLEGNGYERPEHNVFQCTPVAICRASPADRQHQSGFRLVPLGSSGSATAMDRRVTVRLGVGRSRAWIETLWQLNQTPQVEQS